MMSKYITLTVVCSHVRERIVGVGRNTKERGKGDLSGIRLESEKGISLTHMGVLRGDRDCLQKWFT